MFPAELQKIFITPGTLRAFVFATLAFGAFLFWEGTIFIAPVAILCAIAIFLKRWAESADDPNPRLPRFSGRGSFNRNPLGFLTVGASTIRLTLLFVFFCMFIRIHGMPHADYVKGVNVELAKTTNPSIRSGAAREDVVLVCIERDGKIYFWSQHGGNEQVRSDQLPTLITKSVRDGSERRVYIKADARVRYRTVKEVLGEVRASNLENITFLVEQVKATTSPLDEFDSILRQ